jgi:hypothetical protein
MDAEQGDDLLDSQYMKVASEILPGYIYVSGIIPASSEFILNTLKIKRIISLTRTASCLFGAYYSFQKMNTIVFLVI